MLPERRQPRIDNGEMRIRFCLLLWSLLARASAEEILIRAEDAAKKLGGKNLVLLHAGTKADYDAGHLPGAQLVTLMDLAVNGEGGLRLELPPPTELRDRLLRMGVSDQSEVIVYTGGESVQTATRVWFTFDYLSLRAKFLDGGLARWKSLGLPLSTDAPEIIPATELKVQARPELVVDAQWLNQHRNDKNVSLIDARLPEFYSGADKGQFARGGHIPGATNQPFPTWLAADKTFLPVNDLAAKTGDADTIVTYCHIGMQATVPYLAARLAGKNIKLYDGSFQDWSGRAELPVEPKQ
jgi:thiosulfate/3-mercaptopyruvate sulfurtransferase